ncbi:hypothetical protein RchiOBHm_Chr7g0218351 [Rosa chinensis]|uniref:Uncharacterized protein n=1 Tax=Rosa chinensis TaxID=74649 RepID=A0A2P6PC94_ROSCH|nr:hypothetical protein RchiOBHm_Chr7g0218351 [Rosa chinensis]
MGDYNASTREITKKSGSVCVIIKTFFSLFFFFFDRSDMKKCFNMGNYATKMFSWSAADQGLFAPLIRNYLLNYRLIEIGRLTCI